MEDWRIFLNYSQSGLNSNIWRVPFHVIFYDKRIRDKNYLKILRKKIKVLENNIPILENMTYIDNEGEEREYHPNSLRDFRKSLKLLKKQASLMAI